MVHHEWFGGRLVQIEERSRVAKCFTEASRWVASHLASLPRENSPYREAARQQQSQEPVFHESESSSLQRRWEPSFRDISRNLRVVSGHRGGFEPANRWLW